ncbi:HNH endonuclease [Metaclostridioides mangenotii]|uniref:HNH endonuclease n=1 Tax=Metaclostridioides mangenotii TaxID=1540 RepID=UPI001F1F3D47|nr:HNH endonuclease signature motif containing protein [Clostridioides mangenotii]
MNLMTPDLLIKINTYLAERKYYRPYQLKEYKILRAAVLRRDNNECQDCKSKGGVSYLKTKENADDLKAKRLEVHHIVDKRVRPDLFLDLNNLICLCNGCHSIRHKRLESNKVKFENEERW